MQELFYRAATIESDTEGTIKLSFASELPVLRNGKSGVFWEILSHDPGDANFGFINRKGLALQDHNEKLEIGDVVKNSVRIDPDKKTRGEIKLFDEGWQNRAKTDFSNIPVSVGYVLLSFKDEKAGEDKVPVRRYSWSPYEVSLLTVLAADSTVGINRAAEIDLPPKEERKISLNKTMTPEEIAAKEAELKAQRSQIEVGAVTKDKERRTKIRAAADALSVQFKTSHDAEKQIRKLADDADLGGMSVEDFNVKLLEAIPGVRKLEHTEANIGMSDKDLADYSLVRAINSCVENKGKIKNDCPEFDLSVEAGKKYGRSAGSFWIPADTIVGRRGESGKMQRDLQVNVFGNGGATVATQLLTPIIELLRNKMVLRSLGIQVMGGLTSNVAIPRQTGAATAYSLSEIAQVALSTQTLDQVFLTPKRVAATGNYSKELLIQSSIDVENFMRNDMMEVMALRLDLLGFNGQGAASEPLGIMNTPGVGSVLFGAAATYAKLVAFETAINVANSMGGSRAYVTTPSAKGVLKSAAKLLVGATTVAAVALWEDNEINGYPAFDTNQIPNNQMVFGNFNSLIMGLFGGIDVVVDPYTLADKAEVKITTNTFVDFACRHPQEFVVSSDSAAQ